MDVPKSKFGLKKEGKVSARYSLCFSLSFIVFSLSFLGLVVVGMGLPGNLVNTLI